MQNDEKSTVEDRGTLASGFTPDAEFHTIPNSKEFEDVRKFHQKFEQLCFDKPGHLSTAKLRERIDFMQEELDEFKEGADEQNLAKQADALIDLVYVACGTAVMLGLPWDWLWNDVQRANMAKVQGMTHRGTQKDVCKPPGWQPPQTRRILDLAGYDESKWFGGTAEEGPVGMFIEENGRDDVQR